MCLSAISEVRHLDLFSGIGGFALAARRVGWKTVGFCEIEPYAQKVLAKHWPGVPIYEDVRNVTAERLRSYGIIGTSTGEASTVDDTESVRCRYGNDRTNKRQTTGEINTLASTSHSSKSRIDIITGGFPCQDISVAGKQVGIDGERSGLWSELARIIGEVRPRYAVLENVAALLSGDSGRWFQRVLGDLAEIGYDCEWHCIPASHVGAPHRRDRVWIVCYPTGEGFPFGARISLGQSSAEQEPKRPDSEVAYPNGKPEQYGLDGCSRKGKGKTTPAGTLHVGNESTRKPLADTDIPRLERWPKSVSDESPDSGQVTSGGLSKTMADTKFKRPQGQGEHEQSSNPEAATIGQAIKLVDGGFRDFWAVEPEFCGMVDGVSQKLDGGGLNASEGSSTESNTREASEARMSIMWIERQDWIASHRQKSEEQFTRELADALSKLPHGLALEARQGTLEATWQVRSLQQASATAGLLRDTQLPFQEAWLTFSDEEKDWAILAACRGRFVAEWPGVPRVAGGIPKRVDRLKGLGNAIVPQVAEVIFRAIANSEGET